MLKKPSKRNKRRAGSRGEKKGEETEGTSAFDKQWHFREKKKNE